MHSYLNGPSFYCLYLFGQIVWPKKGKQSDSIPVRITVVPPQEFYSCCRLRAKSTKATTLVFLEFLTHALLPFVSCLRRTPQSCGGEEEGSGRGEQVHESAWRWVRRQAHGLAHCAAETSSIAQIERMHVGSWGGQWEGARSGREGGGEGRVLDGRHGGTRLLLFARIADGEDGACTHQPESEPKSAQRECRSLVPLSFPFNFCRFLTSLDRQSPNKSLTYV